MKKYYRVTFKWKITHITRGIFQYGESRLLCKAQSKIDAINQAIEFAQNIPMTEIEDNYNININHYKDGCILQYRTNIEKIIDVKIVNF